MRKACFQKFLRCIAYGLWNEYQLVRTHMIRGRTAISDAKPRNTVHIISIISPQWPIL